MQRPDPSCVVLRASDLPADREWLGRQPHPVIAWGGESPSADVVVGTPGEAQVIAGRVDENPIAALTLVQVLRLNGSLEPAQALDVESMAYAALQGGAEFRHWRERHPAHGSPPIERGEPILLERAGNIVRARLNRPTSRNAMTVEMRDAWVGMLALLELDRSIERLCIEGSGSCFSTGGELAEFGTRPDTATAHWIRTVRSPARMMAALGQRITVHLHGACIGSGLELPAFADEVTAAEKSFFQLPELSMGLIPGAGGTLSVARRIGRQRAAWMVLSGRRINPPTALDWGLIDRIDPATGSGESDRYVLQS